MTRYLAILLLIYSCSSRPFLYPNKTYKKMGKVKANRLVDNCMKESEEFIQSSKGKQILKNTGQGATIGGAMGVVSGIFSGDWLKGLIQGSAIGAAGGGAAGAISPDRLKQAYVNTCLREKKLKVIGWD